MGGRGVYSSRRHYQLTSFEAVSDPAQGIHRVVPIIFASLGLGSVTWPFGPHPGIPHAANTLVSDRTSSLVLLPSLSQCMWTHLGLVSMSNECAYTYGVPITFHGWSYSAATASPWFLGEGEGSRQTLTPGARGLQPNQKDNNGERRKGWVRWGETSGSEGTTEG